MFIEKDEIFTWFSWILDAGVVDDGVLDNTAAWVTSNLVVTVVDAALFTFASVDDGLSVVSLAVALAHVAAIGSDTGGLIPTEILG